jgi:hypothetical protein
MFTTTIDSFPTPPRTLSVVRSSLTGVRWLLRR